jgi:hypothetical protein
MSIQARVPSKRYQRQFAKDWGSIAAPKLHVTLMIDYVKDCGGKPQPTVADLLYNTGYVDHIKANAVRSGLGAAYRLFSLTGNIDRAGVYEAYRGAKPFVKKVVVPMLATYADEKANRIVGWAVSVNGDVIHAAQLA